jgi:glycosyltransferase involved in cell wall biosynthesis
MNVLIVSGIWPPDIGGPASHAPEVARFLLDRGHRVQVVVTADRPPGSEDYPVHFVSRRRPPGLRHAEAVKVLVERARRSDVVYTTGMFGRSSVAAQLARVPLVVKLTADPAYERARRWKLVRGSLEEFQSGAPPSTLPLRALRDWDVRRARHVITPSTFLRDLVLGWGLAPDRVTVLPNPTPPIPQLDPRQDLRRQFGLDGETLVFAGRLTAQKSLDLGIEASRQAGVSLVIAGDGPDRVSLEQLGHARFLGPLTRRHVLELFAAGDASLLPSSWENFPHTVVEALAVGTPVIATRVGGVAEVVRDGENGLVVESGDLAGMVAAIRRYFDDEDLRLRLRANAAESVAGYSGERIYAQLEEILCQAVG